MRLPTVCDYQRARCRYFLCTRPSYPRSHDDIGVWFSCKTTTESRCHLIVSILSNLPFCMGLSKTCLSHSVAGPPWKFRIEHEIRTREDSTKSKPPARNFGYSRPESRPSPEAAKVGHSDICLAPSLMRREGEYQNTHSYLLSFLKLLAIDCLDVSDSNELFYIQSSPTTPVPAKNLKLPTSLCTLTSSSFFTSFRSISVSSPP